MTEGRAGSRLKALTALVFFMFLALTTRLWYLQVMASEGYRIQASENAVRVVEVPASRGRILDVNGVPMVDNQPSLRVVIDRFDVAGHEEAVLHALADLLVQMGKGYDYETLKARFESNKYLPYAPVPVAFHVPREVTFAIGEYPERFPGVAVEEVQDRQYLSTDRTLAAHILGFIGPMNEQQWGTPEYAGYDPNDTVGQAGIEQQYEPYLHGEPGAKKIRVDATGKVLAEIGNAEPAARGDDIRLNLDLATQQLVEQTLAGGIRMAQNAGYKANAGVVVVMDPNTGAIRALASNPTFNPAVYSGGLSSAEAAVLGAGERPRTHPLRVEWRVANDAAPLLDRATDGLYPPGSSIKPFIALSALHQGFADEDDRFSCSGTFEVPQDIPGQHWHNWTTVDLGYMNLREALVQSCDTVFYHFGYYDYWSAFWHEGPTTRELMQKDLRSFGFGETPGIDLPSVSAGVVPDELWKIEEFWELAYENDKKNLMYCEWHMCPGDFINMSIGQGDLRVTPLQLAVGFSAIANGGKICAPRLAKDAERLGGKVVQQFPPDCRQISGYQQDWLKYVRNALAGVPRPHGTAASAFIGFPFGQLEYFGGKTGTAEVPGKQDFSWFVGLARGTDVQGDAHEYVVVALVEQGGHGSETAAPIVRQVVDGLFDLNDPNRLTRGGVAD